MVIEPPARGLLATRCPYRFLVVSPVGTALDPGGEKRLTTHGWQEDGVAGVLIAIRNLRYL